MQAKAKRPKVVKKRVAKATKTLGVAERFYIDQHKNSKTSEEMATESGLDVKLIVEYIAETSPKPKAATKLGDFAHDTSKGFTAMTQQQSENGDKQKPVNREFYKERENQIHKIRPNEPFG